MGQDDVPVFQGSIRSEANAKFGDPALRVFLVPSPQEFGKTRVVEGFEPDPISWGEGQWSVHVEFASSGTRPEFRQTTDNAESPGDFRYRQH
ncbi:MAG TPA: hypothetical protein EYG03_22195 [Planctomycetes bacterium]|nr:hypothetical protein [Planctomycetota bacterium]